MIKITYERFCWYHRFYNRTEKGKENTYVNKADTLADEINGLFERKVEMQTIKYGKKQSIDKLINQESPFAKVIEK